MSTTTVAALRIPHFGRVLKPRTRWPIQGEHNIEGFTWLGCAASGPHCVVRTLCIGEGLPRLAPGMVN